MIAAFGEGFGFRHKSLIYLIGAAIFVNFSAFFTLFIFDISHILFMLFFNALDATTWGGFSPFAGYSQILGDVGTGGYNLIVGLIAVVVNWFIVLGLLYYCIILIERYIIALFLVLLSPVAALGFFTSLSGGNPLAAKLSGVYEQRYLIVDVLQGLTCNLPQTFPRVRIGLYQAVEMETLLSGKLCRIIQHF